jgi:hypothetical protein
VRGLLGATRSSAILRNASTESGSHSIKGRLLGSFSRSAFVNWARYVLQFGSQLVLPEALCQEGCVR